MYVDHVESRIAAESLKAQSRPPSDPVGTAQVVHRYAGLVEQRPELASTWVDDSHLDDGATGGQAQRQVDYDTFETADVESLGDEKDAWLHWLGCRWCWTCSSKLKLTYWNDNAMDS